MFHLRDKNMELCDSRWRYFNVMESRRSLLINRYSWLERCDIFGEFRCGYEMRFRLTFRWISAWSLLTESSCWTIRIFVMIKSHDVKGVKLLYECLYCIYNVHVTYVIYGKFINIWKKVQNNQNCTIYPKKRTRYSI